MIYKDIIDRIKNITHGESSRAYENAVTSIATDLDDANLIQQLNIDLKETEDKNKKLKIYAILFNYHRRMDNIDTCQVLYNEYYEVFNNTFIFNHLFSIILKSTKQVHKIKQSIKLSRDAITYINEHTNPGALHNLADGLITLCEESDTIDIKLRNDYITEALELVEDALKLEPDYAKFYATLARAYLLLDDLYAANKNIHLAIAKENSEKKDYILRINKYSLILSYIDTKKHIKGLLQQVKGQTDTLQEEIRKENLEILSFLMNIHFSYLTLMELFL